MIIEEHSAETDERFLIAAGLKPARSIYFDIETTGLKAQTSHLYLIGYAVKNPASESGTWQIVQLFAEKTADEKKILIKFSEICEKYDTVIHFNGDRFDIPYLEEKYREYDLPSPLSSMTTFDIYRMVRPYRNLFGLDRLNQKTIEKFLGIQRKDRYDGGQLIEVYRSYRDGLSADREEDLGKLMLHNYEDVLGMFTLSRLTAYPLAMKGRRAEIRTALSSQPENFDGQKRPDLLKMSFEIPVPVPAPVYMEKDFARISLSRNICEVSVVIAEETLFHYFADYKNYYYLPEEDRAVHKSVAQFVDSGHRERAKADNCYVKKSGRFLPVPSEMEFDKGAYPVYHHFRKEKTEWVELTDGLLKELADQPDAAERYLEKILDAVRK